MLDITESGKRGSHTIRVFEAHLKAFNAAVTNAFVRMTAPNDQDSLLSDKILTDGSTYFFDIQFAVNGRKYMKISESRRTNNMFERIAVILFEEAVDPFRTGYEKALSRISS